MNFPIRHLCRKSVEFIEWKHEKEHPIFIQKNLHLMFQLQFGNMKRMENGKNTIELQLDYWKELVQEDNQLLF